MFFNTTSLLCFFGIYSPAWGAWESLSQQSQVTCPSCLKLSSIEFQPFTVSTGCDQSLVSKSRSTGAGKKASRKEKRVAFFLFHCSCLIPIVSFDPSLELFQNFSKVLTETLYSHLALTGNEAATGNTHPLPHSVPLWVPVCLLIRFPWVS